MWDCFILSLITFLLYYLNCEFGPFESIADCYDDNSDANKIKPDTNYNIKSATIQISDVPESSALKNQKYISDIHVKY